MPPAARLWTAVWWGGLTFYAGVVVPIGTDVLGATTQGFVTQRVTHWLNGAGAIAIVLTVGEVFRLRSRGTWIAWGTVATTLAVLAALHPAMDVLLEVGTHTVADGERFYSLHRVYLWVTAVQWLAGGWLLARLTPFNAVAHVSPSDTRT